MTERFILGRGGSTAHSELRRAVKLDVYAVLGPGLIHSDSSACHMHFSAAKRRQNGVCSDKFCGRLSPRAEIISSVV